MRFATCCLVSGCTTCFCRRFVSNGSGRVAVHIGATTFNVTPGCITGKLAVSVAILLAFDLYARHNIVFFII